jgi:hypothetical protein
MRRSKRNPLNAADRSGLAEGEIELPCFWPFCGAPPPAVEGLKEIGEGIAEGAEITWHGVEHAWNWVFNKEGCHEAPPGAIDAERALKELAKEHPNIPRGQLGKALEKAKGAVGLGAADDTLIDPRTGEIYDKETGEHIGNIFD